MAYNAYIYSFADLGLSGVPVNGQSYLTSPTLAPDILSIQDSGVAPGTPDTLFDSVKSPVGPPVIDTNQALASNLFVDNPLAPVGSTGDFVFTDTNSASITLPGAPPTIIEVYTVLVLPAGTTTPIAVGFVSSQAIPPNTLYSYSSNTGSGDVLYANLANCFTTDTMIECENGPKAVQDIVEGDLIVTRDNSLQAVRWVGRRVVVGTGDMAPVRLKAGVLGNSEDLLVSPMHRMVVGGPRAEVLYGVAEVLAHASHLCDGDRIFREPVAQVTYFHLLFDRHEIINAYGCWSESFAPSVAAMSGVEEATRAEILKLFPQLDDTWQDVLPTLSASEAAMVLPRH